MTSARDFFLSYPEFFSDRPQATEGIESLKRIRAAPCSRTARACKAHKKACKGKGKQGVRDFFLKGFAAQSQERRKRASLPRKRVSGPGRTLR